VLERVSRPEQLKSNSWLALNSGKEAKITVCVGEMTEKRGKTITYGVTKKTERKLPVTEYSCALEIAW
jgi:hypothetical protein